MKFSVCFRGESTKARCGVILMEKGNSKTGSPYGKSQAIPWRDVQSKYRKAFKVIKTSAGNTRSVTPHQILTAMGTTYHWNTNNCQDAASKGWDLWHGKHAEIIGKNEYSVFAENNLEECCLNTEWKIAKNEL